MCACMRYGVKHTLVCQATIKQGRLLLSRRAMTASEQTHVPDFVKVQTQRVSDGPGVAGASSA